MRNDRGIDNSVGQRIDLPLTSDVDGALGEVAVDGSAVLASLAGTDRREWNGWEVHRKVARIGGSEIW